MTTFDFSYAIELLREGRCIARTGWAGRGLFVFKQVPSSIGSEIIPKMQSVPQKAKQVILRTVGHIDYENQCVIYDTKTGIANSWVPSISNMFAADWYEVE